MELKHLMEFKAGFTTVFKGKITFTQARRMGLNLAKKHNAPINLYVYNDGIGKWRKMLLEFRPDGYGYIGNKQYYLDADGRNFWPTKQHIN